MSNESQGRAQGGAAAADRDTQRRLAALGYVGGGVAAAGEDPLSRPDPKAMVLVFGLAHGFGLATKLQALALSRDGLVANIVAFNIGVEGGQIAALIVILTAMTWWRRTTYFARSAVAANTLLMAAGLVLAGQQIAGFLVEKSA